MGVYGADLQRLRHFGFHGVGLAIASQQCDAFAANRDAHHAHGLAAGVAALVSDGDSQVVRADFERDVSGEIVAITFHRVVRDAAHVDAVRGRDSVVDRVFNREQRCGLVDKYGDVGGADTPRAIGGVAVGGAGDLPNLLI